MDTRLRQINREFSSYDRDLYAIRVNNGMIQIYRKAKRWVTYQLDDGSALRYDVLNPQFILALTDNWLLSGTPVDHGMEPLIARLRSMDQWRDDCAYSDVTKDREQREEIEKRSLRNEIRARAADLRQDFAKATNDINTSILDKTDRRRTNDVYR